MILGRKVTRALLCGQKVERFNLSLNAMLMEMMKVYWLFFLWVSELYNMYCVSLIPVAFLDLRFDHSVDLNVGKFLQIKMSKCLVFFSCLCQ